MAWRCSGQTHLELVERLRNSHIISSENVLQAMKATDRGYYLGRKSLDTRDAYLDQPLGIGHSQTISAPHMHAYALELAASKLKPGARVLDVGSGSGYLSVAMAHMVSPNGVVYGIEPIPALVTQSIENLQADKKASGLLSIGVLSLSHGDGWVGLPSQAPFDVIHVGAAAATTPQALLDQLNPNGGILIIPVGGQYEEQYLRVYTRTGQSDFSRKDLMAVRYVPLVKSND